MILTKNREYFNSPSVYRGSTAKPGGSLKNDFLDSPFYSVYGLIILFSVFLYIFL